MNHLIDQQLRRNDCGISAVKTVCNILEIPIPRTIIEDSVFLDEQGASLDSIQKFFVNNGFLTQYKLVDINTLNDNSKEYQALFPCITPVKNKGSLHYVVLNGLQNEKFKVLDPAEMRHYTLSVQEFKKKAYFSSTQMQYVDVSEKLRVSIYQELKQRRIHLPHEPSDKELITLFNKFTYFSYICENFGFKDEQAENAFLKDLIFNQDVGAVPSHFRSMKLEKAKVQIKAPILLSVKKGEDLAQFTPPEDPTENVYWKLFKSISSVKDIWMIFVVTAMIAAFINYVAVFINQILIDHILPSYQLDTLILFAVGIGIFSLFDMIFYTYKKFISIHLGNTLDKYFLQVFDQKLNNYSIRYLQSFKRGDLTERLSDSLKIKSFFMRYFSKIFINAIIALFSIGLLMMLHMQLTFIVIVVLICFLIIFYVLTPIIKQLERQRFTQKAQFFSKFIEKIDGIQVIKAMRLEAYSSSEINASIDSLIKVQTKSKYIGLLNSILGTLIVTIASLFIIVLTAKEMIVNQSITLGMIISFVALSGKIFSAFNSLLSANLSLQEHQVILNRFFDFSERKQEATKNPQTPTTTSSGTAHLTISKGFQQFTRIRDFSLDKLSLRNVFFTYNEEKFVLKDISFDLNSGDKIWIQGSNGSGKSTLCKILGLLYEPSKGDVLLNGLQISMYNRQILRSKVLFVSGEDLIFNNTLLFNITFGRAVDMRRLIAYAKVLNFYEFIEQQPSQFDYVIHENGKNLSTGQRKKILLLRALLSDAEVLLVDEIFSGMDKASRQRAAQLISLINDRTFILISHLDIQDISFTKIYKLKHGQLLEQGT